MKRLIVAACCLMLAAAPALAQDKGKAESVKKAPSAAQKKQQERMKACTKDAGDKKLKGDARKKFMSDCLKG
ncbi:MAG: hypothetical protein EPN19_09525 [Betaproteobacteria bacterium]|nr:MAG: hypothetical protein EPN19_09525 [Betaproteobacteria bacterium]